MIPRKVEHIEIIWDACKLVTKVYKKNKKKTGEGGVGGKFPP